ncbi:ImmA/IrrE family metallo-endopeptidase [Comamonas sp. JC664]|uniref:ImmA/IrrE family metallo-endopeptidase n=1 Tax=Comamonas sp. JC664 TaxID=2801917 RepID=UPI00174DAA63|nr:ImmA/IrrE family metallo-endopeptidase [Comamonas sp. JC664]MBL0696569.1 ImmA/IrrE family metallo-endopeptidase [Comamonas sp. JC664]GHG84868.1 hypothetical protein GCM10012319_40980 [Comamonas sp. KCTC 72670]
MTELWLKEALEASGLAHPTSFPRDLESDTEDAFPEIVTPVVLKGLTSATVASWFTQMCIDIDYPVPTTPRRFRGCMVANKGRAFLFRDRNDKEDEQLFTLAHEVSHFVLDHMLPRARALKKYGPSFLPVLDALRPPTHAEQLALALDQFPIGIQMELMERDDSGFIQSGNVVQAERRADRLAFELLAPADIAYPYIKSLDEERGPAQLATLFGMPLQQAQTYAQMLMRRERLEASSVVQFRR